MSKLLKPFIDQNGIFILDGGFSNQLEVYDSSFSKSEFWTSKVLLEKSDLVKKVYIDYLNVGSNVITTPTYQAFIQNLTKVGLNKDQIKNLFQLSVNLGEMAIQEYLKNNQIKKIKNKPIIAISLGPYGAYLPGGKEYHGDYEKDCDFLEDFHRERLNLAVNIAKNKHLIAFETIPNFNETKSIVKLIAQYPNVEAWLSFSCKNGENIRDGTPFEKVLELTREVKQIVAVGVNCTNPEFVSSLLTKMINCNLNKLLIAYPNKGEKYDDVKRCFIENSKSFDYIMHVKEWHDRGLNGIGGCCRITPDDIKKISDQFEN